MAALNWRAVIAIATAALILVLVNLSIAGKETLLAEGRVVYLQLAPVDPRSLMQGDYMALNYTVAQQAASKLYSEGGADDRSGAMAAADGRIVVRLDNRSVASFVRIEDGRPLADNEVAMRYRVRNGTLKFATNAYFFQEGTGERYRKARYGMFRVAPDGELLLTNLCDENLHILN